MKKTPTTKQLRDRLDKVCSRIVRYRDAYDLNGEITVMCCTCGQEMLAKQSQCGHWIRRGVTETRWDLDNMHVQDAACNTFRDGMEILHRVYIVDRHGEETAQRLEQAFIKHRSKPVPYRKSEMKDKLKELLPQCRELETKWKLKPFPKSWEGE